jgi:hypothetical protein
MYYIVVGFWDGLGHTLQTNGKMNWFFTHHPKYYSKLPFAVKMARKLNARYILNRIVVYKVDIEERFSCSDFSRWDKEDGRIEFEISNVKNVN